MKKLTNMFKMNETILLDAIYADDTAQVSAMRGKKVSFGGMIFQRLDYGTLSVPMMQVLVRDVTDGDWQKWGFKENARDTLRCAMFSVALSQSRADLIDVFTAENIVMNKGKASAHCFMDLCDSKLADEAKGRVLDYLLAQGIDQVKEPETFLKKAAERGYAAGFDAMKSRLNIDIHADNEHILRYAAGAGQVDFCLHLARTYGADIDVALITESTLGHQKAAKTLEEARQILNPEAEAAPSIAGLAAQVRVLERTVAQMQDNMRDITARLDDLSPQRRLDKRLTSPAQRR